MKPFCFAGTLRADVNDARARKSATSREKLRTENMAWAYGRVGRQRGGLPFYYQGLVLATLECGIWACQLPEA